MSIKVISGALDVVEIDGEESFALRGVIDPQSLGGINVPKYQREILSKKKIDELIGALRNGRVPDVDLGMRGDNYREREGSFYLQDPVFVIDGLQRLTAAGLLLDEGIEAHLGALIHFDTNEQWERERFEDLNLGQTALSGNVTLRNKAATSEAAKTMLRVTEDKGFILCGLVSWGQNMRRGDLITAITFYKTVSRLHAHAGPGRSSSVLELVSGLEKIMANVGRHVVVANAKAFFELIDKCWGVRNVAYRDYSIQLKSGFLQALASVVSDHSNFWDGDRLSVPNHIAQKLATFQLTDPTVIQLAGSSGTARQMLEILLVKHINSGRRTRQLRPRDGLQSPEGDEGDDE